MRNSKGQTGLLRWLTVILLLSPLSLSAADFSTALRGLDADDFNAKGAAIDQFAAIDDERVVPVLKVMLDGRLYRRKHDAVLVELLATEEGYAAREVTGAERSEDVNKRDFKKVSVNNALRIQLRSTIAQLSLNNRLSEVRLSAVEEMMKGLDSDGAALLRERWAVEKSRQVRETIEVALALVDIQADDAKSRTEAFELLSTSLYPEARAALLGVLENEASSASDKKAAQSALGKIEKRLALVETAETIFFGLSLGSVLLLSAIGLAITFGVMGVINMAHGELMMLGAYTTYLVQLAMPNAIDYSLWVAVPAAFIVAGLFGIAIERGVIRHLYGRPLETLLATFGISLILQQLVRTTISAQNVAVSNPGWMSGSLEIGQAFSLTFNRLYILLFALMVFVGLLLILKKTALGLHVRAVSQNRAMARAMGIRSDWVDAMTFGLGSGIAGIAGVALSQLTNVGPNMGQAYIIDSFMVVVFGGVGNLWGTLVGAFSLGVANKLIEPTAGAVLAKILVLVFIILFIQKRPRGLFPQKGRAAEH